MRSYTRKEEIGEQKKKQGCYSHFMLLVYYMELFYQTGYQNSSSSAVHGAKTLENGFTSEVKPCQTFLFPVMYYA
jgi:hypothetical protein